MKFLKLHSMNGEIYRINFDNIESYGTITSKTYDGSEVYIGKTFLCPAGMTDNEKPYIVNETPEQIDKLIGFGGVE